MSGHQNLLPSHGVLDWFILDHVPSAFLEPKNMTCFSPVYSLSFAPQYINAGDIRISPDSVTIYGEPFHLASIDKVYTESLRLNDLTASVHGQTRLDKIKGVRISDETVTYSMPVARYVEICKTLSVYTDNVPKGHNLIVYPSTATVRFRCAFPVSHDPSEKVRLSVDYQDFISSLEGQCLPRLDSIPSGVIGYTVEPKIFDCVESVK